MLAGKLLGHPPHPCVREYFRWKQGLPMWHTPDNSEKGFAYAVEHLLRMWGKAGKKWTPRLKVIPTVVPETAQFCAVLPDTPTAQTPDVPMPVEDFEEDEYEEDEVDLSMFLPTQHHTGVVSQLEQIRRELEGHDQWGEPVRPE